MTLRTYLAKGPAFILASVASILAFGQLSASDVMASQKAKLLRALVAKGDSSSKAGAIETAVGAYYLARRYLPDDRDIQSKLDSAQSSLDLRIAEGSVARMTVAELFQFSTGADLSDPESFGDYRQPTSDVEVTSLKMLFDERLVGKLRIGVYSHRSGAGVSFFLWKPTLNAEQVKKLYGPPTSEQRLDRSLVALYYGVLRLIATSSGEIVAVHFRNSLFEPPQEAGAQEAKP